MFHRTVMILKYRFDALASDIRVLWLNLIYGWTTQKQRSGRFAEGYAAVESATHYPANTYQHPLLREQFDAGADIARDDFRIEDEEEYMRDVQDTYDAIRRQEMADIYDECRELGLVP